MSWRIVTEEERQRIEAAQMDSLARAFEECRKKEAARQAWIKNQTCPHCGQCRPLPVWLM